MLKNSVSGRADTGGVVNQRSRTFFKLPTQLYFLSESLNTGLLRVHRSESACATVLQSSFLLGNSAVSREGTVHNFSWKWCGAKKSFADRMFIFMLDPCLLSFLKSLSQMNQTEIRMNETT